MNCKWAMRRIVGEFGGVTGVQIWAKRGVERLQRKTHSQRSKHRNRWLRFRANDGL